jgi:hypothetical protein
LLDFAYSFSGAENAVVLTAEMVKDICSEFESSIGYEPVVFLAGQGSSTELQLRGVYDDVEKAKAIKGVNINQPVMLNEPYNPMYLVESPQEKIESTEGQP